MDKRLSDFDKVMSCLLEPLGDYAPKRRYLLLDYNDSSGADLHHEALQYVPRGVTDRDLVRLFWEDLARQGYRLSSICEPQEDGGIAILYAAPGFLEECFSDQGLPVPDDIPAALAATVRFPDGWHQAQRGEPISFPYRWGANLSPHPPLSFYGRTRKTDRRPLSTKKFRNGCLPPVSNSQALVKTCSIRRFWRP